MCDTSWPLQLAKLVTIELDLIRQYNRETIQTTVEDSESQIVARRLHGRNQ